MLFFNLIDMKTVDFEQNDHRKGFGSLGQEARGGAQGQYPFIFVSDNISHSLIKYDSFLTSIGQIWLLQSIFA